MQSRRDQVDAQSHVMTRLAGALVRAEPDAVEPPTRRDLRGTLAGFGIALLALGGVGAWALFSASGSTAWQRPGTLIVDKNTGSRYLLAGDALRPVLNIASAHLLLGSGMTVATVPTKRLKNVPRGEPVGVPGAPDALPRAPLLNRGVWRVCATRDTPDATPAVPVPEQPPAAGPGAAVQVGATPSGDRVAAGEGLLVAVGEQQYLLWGNRRHAVTRAWAADVLGFGNVAPQQVPRRWLDLLPAGPDVAPVLPEGRGEPGPEVAGARATIGQIYRIEPAGSTPAHYVAVAGGLAPLTETQYQLTIAEPGAGTELPLAAADLANAVRVPLPRAGGDLPPRPPAVRAVQPPASPCVEYPGPDGLTMSLVRAELPLALRVPRRDPGTGDAEGPAPLPVQVAPGGGALVVTRADVPAKDQAPVLVDDSGTAYPLADAAVSALGYAKENAVAVPRELLTLLPAGPLLDQPKGD